jgi:hypothetical protein
MRDHYLKGETFRSFLTSVQHHETLWQQLTERAELPPEAAETAGSWSGQWYFLVLAEDWCGDAVHVLPYLALLEKSFPNFQLRILSREENPDLMNAHLTNGTRSIPVVMILDEDYQEVGWWGPRPGPLQELFHQEIKHLPREQRFLRIRAWFAGDRGRTTLREILSRIPVVV